ncbi:MAG: relaxase/mobilization nuclease domain-containing protein [Solirubrobacteraceae bacterium]
MVPNVTHGGRTRGLLRYLTSPKEQADERQLVGLEPRELHTNPHVLAGYEGVREEWGGYDLSPRYNPSAAGELAAWLDEPRVRSGARVTRKRRDRDGNVVMDDRGQARRTDAHVWHCSLSLDPHDPELSDNQWREIAERFIDAMGFADHRWLAIRHGRSPGSEQYPDGQDHIHVVVQLVGENGKAANIHNDFNRAQEECRALERDYGLRVLEGRAAKRGARATNYRQRYRAEREHQAELIDSPKPDRDQLEAKLRVAGAGAGSEAEFVRMLRADGLLVRPRFAAGRDDEVVGYSVALAPAPGRDPVWHAGGKVAKDLTLPRLRSDGGWTAQDPEAIDEWQRAFRGDPPARPPAPAGDPDVQRAVAELRAVRDAAAHDTAGAARTGAASFYGWAALEPELAPRLEPCAIELSRSAQTRAAASRPVSSRAPSLPLLAAALVNPSNKTLWRLALLQEMMALSSAVAAAHNAAGELARAERLLAEVRGHLGPLRVGFEDAHAAVDPEYARQLQSYRAAQEARRLNEIATGGVPPRAGRSDTAAAAHPGPPDRRPPTQRPGRRR